MAGMDPWEAAHTAASRAGVDLVPVRDMDGAGAGANVVEGLWGKDILPRELIRAFAHAGGTVFGARSLADGVHVGFVLGFLGWDEGLHVHSHILGVSPEWQSRGVGFALKLAQRAASLEHEIEEVRWTYDPLIAKNARFNLVRLGAVATGILPSFYGEMRDRVNRGDRSDRFEIRWRLRSRHVDEAIAVGLTPFPVGEPLLKAKGDPDVPEPVPTGRQGGPGATVAVPRDYLGLRDRDPALARRWRDASARAFAQCFERGAVAAWMTPEGVYQFVSPEDVR